MYTQPVLIVDDDPLFTVVVTGALSTLGVTRVKTAKDGGEALAQIERAEPAFGLILLNLTMPTLNAHAFLSALAGSGFSGDVILCSGESDVITEMASNLGRMLHVNIVGTLRKPVTVDGVAQLLMRTSNASAREAG